VSQHDTVIAAQDLTKIYKLYKNPQARLLDLFGLLRRKEGAYTQHAALDGVSFRVRRGEKLALIGRNGAGKSTLLKLVTGTIKPTAGTLQVQGHTTALLQIGTGFHPEFTGRQNVVAYLACLGVSGAGARARVAEIIEFSELQEYIDQPLKTYSTGMAARLMFSTATSLAPDLLVLDEVLGVGDAYFARKSYERIRDLCLGKGTTVLLVTHDVYSASQICDRMIWLERGKVLMDGASPTVVKAYEDSIREQEEHRLRLRKQQRMQELQQEQPRPPMMVLVELRAPNNQPLPGPVHFSRLDLVRGAETVASLPLGAEAFGPESISHLQREACCWGEPAPWQGRQTRPMQNYGSPFHKVAGVFVLPAAVAEADLAGARLVVDAWSQEACELRAHVFINGAGRNLGSLTLPSGHWETLDLPLTPQETAAAPKGNLPEINTAGVHGTGTIRIHDVKALGPDGETHLLHHGEPFTLLVHYEIPHPRLSERAQVVVALHRDGVQDVCRLITRDLLFEATRRPRGSIRLHLPRLPLAPGKYTVTVLIARQGYYDEEQVLFYSINPGVYACVSRILEIEVRGGGLIAAGTGVVAEGQWSLVDAARVPEREVNAA
jgi:ABC-type polysaccharide/polyol phosphate transport system ATPase subunit